MRIPVSISFETFRIRLIDLIIFFLIVGIFSLIVYIASQWGAPYERSLEIELGLQNIFGYVVQSIVRIFFAYLLSLIFSIWYGYAASRSKIRERIMIPLLDILQSIPVLSFLPGVVLAMIAIFPEKRIGLEIACVLLIFTGQVWNMTFSFYHSINTVPREMVEVVKVFKWNKFSKFLRLDLPFSAIGLVWNSMMSVAGGWFFLMACEMFVLEGKDFRLPGLGSYIQTAANKGDIVNVIYGLGTMIALIILIDFIIWRPIIVWSQKFRLGSIPPEEERESFVYNLFVSSVFLRRIGDLVSNVINKIERLYYKEFPLVRSPFFKVVSKGVSISFLFIIMLAIMWALFKAFYLVSSISLVDIFLIIKASFYSLLRVFAALLIALLWTLPVGVFIGLNPRAAKYLQGIVQIAASVPATAIFPVIILFIIRFGGGLDIGAILLMLLGTQWYLLFNIIAGASAIPKDLIEISRAYKIKGLKRWKTLILPGIFPYLVNGLITASGGAWNATIVSEYVSFGGGIIKTVGLGALINSSSASGDFRFLLLSTCFMSLIVVSINRLVWKRLFILAKTKYVLE